MALKPRLIRRWQKECRKLGKITKVEVLNKDDDGTIWPDKKEWGYSVELEVNGHKISCADDSWYDVWQGAAYAARWASTTDIFNKEANDQLLLNVEEVIT